jgi:type III restriction enzyme
VGHFRSYLSEEDVHKVLRLHQREIARFIHAQMQEHYWEEATGYEVVVTRGFNALRDCAYTSRAGQAPLDYRQSPADKSNMARYLFGGFRRCLYSVQKFDSDAERKLAIILDRDSLKWFRPARSQFLIFYRLGGEQREYQPDFVAETDDRILMLEPKMRGELGSAEVLAKRDAAVLWCQRASDHAATYGGKPWEYALIPHDVIAENRTVAELVAQFGTEL